MRVFHRTNPQITFPQKPTLIGSSDPTFQGGARLKWVGVGVDNALREPFVSQLPANSRCLYPSAARGPIGHADQLSGRIG